MARVNFLKTMEVPHKRSHKILWYRKQILLGLWVIQTILTIWGFYNGFKFV